jgi:hydroxymethylpyrimidine/phosphomethylpyrimidine kinase
MSAITSLTAQNTTGVYDLFNPTGEFVYKQIKLIFDDIGIDAAKIGMLANMDILQNVAKAIRDFNIEKLVLDPVLKSTSGKNLLSENSVDLLIKEIIPFSLIVTPNIDEAEVLADIEIKNWGDIESAAKIINNKGAKVVIIKGGHFESGKEIVDVVLINGSFHYLRYPKVETKNTHGTGCTFSAAITAYLAKGFDTLKSIRLARAYLQGAIENSLKLGHGNGPLNHNWIYL